MGSKPINSVVDSELRLWGCPNCYVSSTAVFPLAGSTNPGLTHLALTARLADHLEGFLK
jgi:choline dehydrogenase-like flavoprotein